MCTHRILAKSAHGEIIICEKCQHIQLFFGSLLLALTQEQFDTFKNYAEETLPMYFAGKQEKQEVWIPFSRVVCMMLTASELAQLNRLLQDAQTKLAYFQLLQNVSKN